MRQPSPIGSRAALCVLALAALSPGVAGASGANDATAAAASPYRLKATTDRLAAVSAAAYVGDTRYRLAPEVQGASAPAASMAPDLGEKPYARQIDVAAREAGVDAALVHAVVAVESAYRAAAVSPKGAVGLMQVLPQTASRYGVADPSAVGDNLRAGARHLRRLMDKYDDRLELALAAYNAGEGAVSHYGERIPPYAETRDYVPKVIASYRANGPRIGVPAAQRAVVDYLPGTRLDKLALVRLRNDDRGTTE